MWYKSDMGNTKSLAFMVVALPRSATTWVSNWLTTDKTLCLHDPLYTCKLEDLDSLKSEKLLGISCTAIFRFNEYLDNHPARKLVIHRDLDEINASLRDELGVNTFTEAQDDSLYDIDGLHVTYNQLFDTSFAKTMYEHLLELPFDEERYNYLVGLNIQPNFGTIKFDKEVLNDFRKRMTL
jgi:hypothetical protein